MTKDEATAVLREQIEEAEELKSIERNSPQFKKWRRDTEVAIGRIFGDDTRHLNDFTNISYSLHAFSGSTPDRKFRQAYIDGLDRAQAILHSFIEEIEDYGFDESEQPSSQLTELGLLETICSRFHLVARQLRARYDERPTLKVEDEYDVQDLFHALLVLHFEDVRPEEYTPSYAGSGSRVDFLLKEKGIVVEVKKTRDGLEAGEVGEQLMVDIQRYQSHPDCETLICFVYDPEGRIGNPRGLENDLNQTSGDLRVIVYVKPMMQ
jgi:hypothetical protein